MEHPEVLLVPALMLSDYVLTIAGARLREGGYAEHFRTAHYEMNPVWQKAVAKKRWINPRHLLAVAVVTLLFYAMANEATGPSDPVLTLAVGFVIGLLGMINGRHLANLATFAYLKREPDAIVGVVTIGHLFALRLSMVQSFAAGVPLALLAAIDPQPSTFGATLGVASAIPLHLVWIARFRAKSAQSAETGDVADSSSPKVSPNLPPPSGAANDPA